jgi:prepilin-type processing-associated H-X9-DG protein
VSYSGGTFSEEDWNRPASTSAGYQAYWIGYSIYNSNRNADAWTKSRYPDVYNNIRPPFKSNEHKLAERPLVFDITYVSGPPWGPYVTWGYSAHMSQKTRKPEGANTLYGDGHVAWKNFSDIKYRAGYPNQSENFW